MTDTLWSDVSEFQPVATDAYPHGFLMFRSNDGTYLDKNFTANLAWAKDARARGKLWGFGVYYFFRPGVNGAQILMDRVGKPDQRMIAMIDLESDEGRVSGDHSAQLHHEHDKLAGWLGNAKRVIGYGNTSDLNSLWPSKPPGTKLVVAAYGSNPPYPGKFAHQFSDTENTPPFGPSDINSADGMSAHDLQVMYGFMAATPVPQRHVVGPLNMKSLSQEVGSQLQAVIELTHRELNTPNRDVFDAYLALNSALRVAGHKDAKMPHGMVYWTP